jgi:hypothetical protein
VGRDGGRVDPPGCDGSSQPRLDPGEVLPRQEGPAFAFAEFDQSALGEDHVRIGGGIAVAFTVADEDHRPARGLVAEDTLALARPAHETVGMAVGEGHGRVFAVERGVGRDHRDRRDAHPGQGRFDVEAEAVTHHFDGNAEGQGGAHERGEGWIVGLCLGQCHDLVRDARQKLDLALEQSPRSDLAGVVGGIVRRVTFADEVVEDAIGDVDLRDRAVVIDEDGERRLPGPENWDGGWIRVWHRQRIPAEGGRPPSRLRGGAPGVAIWRPGCPER